MRDLLFFILGFAFMGWLWYLHRYIDRLTLPVILIDRDEVLFLERRK